MKNKEHSKLGLTQSQLFIWLGQRLHPDMPLYNMVHSFELVGNLNVNAFQKAFLELIRKADSLRTVFREENAEPVQFVLNDYHFELPLIDFSGNGGESAASAWIKQRSGHIFNLAEPLFDSAILILSGNRFIWYLNIHHLVTDATSSALLQKNMAYFYHKCNINSSQEIKEIPPFKDYVIFEIGERKKAGSEKISEYWRNKLEGLMGYPELYGSSNNKSGTETRRISLKLGIQRSERIRNLLSQKDLRLWTAHLTLFNFFATILVAFVYRTSGRHKFAIGAPTHNRLTSAFKETPGLFIEFFGLFGEVSEDETFRTLFHRTKLETNNYLRYARAGMSSAALNRSYNVVLNYINSSFEGFDGFKMKSEWVHPGHCDPSHKLRCHIVDFDDSGEIELLFDLNNSSFHYDLQQRVPTHFLKLLDAMLDDIDTPIDRPILVTASEIEEFPAPVASEFTFASIVQLFENSVSDHPHAIAVKFGDSELTYGTLNRMADHLAGQMAARGVVAGSTVGIYLHRSPEYIISVLAVLKLHATFVPVASDQPLNRVRFMLENAGCGLVLSGPALQNKLHGIGIPVLEVDMHSDMVPETIPVHGPTGTSPKAIAYILYTSGSTGQPKGVMISQDSLSNYLQWACSYYSLEPAPAFPFFTSVGFDLTITSVFLPLLLGGKVVIYREPDNGPDMSIMPVIADNQVTAIKLTPSHLQLFKGSRLSNSLIKTIIVGGEDFKTNLADWIYTALDGKVHLYNEYGPTEATVGCIVHEYQPSATAGTSVPIGRPISNMQAYVLDANRNMVPQGVPGELYLSGKGLAAGYLSRNDLTSEKFVPNPFQNGSLMYATGDLARYREDYMMEYLGREDEQVKFNGYRIELAEIEARLMGHPMIESAAVVLSDLPAAAGYTDLQNCIKCGLPSNYPQADFDENGVCNLCIAFEGFRENTKKYFGTEDELIRILTTRARENKTYDCLALLSGGKDSTYVLARLVNMGLKVLAYTLDNGYISGQAKDNISRVVKVLGVDHIYGQTPYMNKIFVDSLHRHQNVCNGCFKTLYTLSTRLALEKHIPFIVTGLSRGQFFETRLSEELFWDKDLDPAGIDDLILQARKVYHQEDDAVKKLLDVSMYKDPAVFEKVRFIDFYRYSDVSLEEMLRFLDEKLGWVRPTNTGRSTNCLINQAGIQVHKTKKGYSNYSFPYSWDVRLGHKTRDESLEEINEAIDLAEVQRILKEIGYGELDSSETGNRRLVAFYKGKDRISYRELQQYLASSLPDYMVPGMYRFLDEIPLNLNGKIDKFSLVKMAASVSESETFYVAPSNDTEAFLTDIWKQVLNLNQVGVRDNFVVLGGQSLAAIRITTRINEELGINIPLSKIFELPTISEYARFIEDTLVELME